MSKREPSPAFTAARELAKRVGKMTDSEKAAFVARFPQPVTVEGHPLSAHNSIMLLTQCETATLVGGFRQWIKAGRCVSKGQHALWIFAPSTRKETDENGEEGESVYFRLVPVFDISQTSELEAAPAELEHAAA